MSKAISAAENLEEISKNLNVKLEIDEEGDTYNFEFIKKPKINSDSYMSKVTEIISIWSFYSPDVTCGSLPKRFLSHDRKEEILHMNLEKPFHMYENWFKIEGFSISRKYGKAKNLADYLLEQFQEKQKDVASGSKS